MTRILITGAAGAIGSTLREGLRGAYEVMRLSDMRALGACSAGDETIEADLRDADADAVDAPSLHYLVL